jgi:hypothetical protein
MPFHIVFPLISAFHSTNTENFGWVANDALAAEVASFNQQMYGAQT